MVSERGSMLDECQALVVCGQIEKVDSIKKFLLPGAKICLASMRVAYACQDGQKSCFDSFLSIQIVSCDRCDNLEWVSCHQWNPGSVCWMTLKINAYTDR